jgi:hypothetical protein
MAEMEDVLFVPNVGITFVVVFPGSPFLFKELSPGVRQNSVWDARVPGFSKP